MPEAFDPYHKWLGIPPSEQPPHHYRLLGIELFEADDEVIVHAADRQMAHLRTFQAGRYSAEAQKLLNEVAAARLCLLKPAKRAEYDSALRASLASLPAAAVATSPTLAPPATAPTVQSETPSITERPFVPPLETLAMPARASRPHAADSRRQWASPTFSWKVLLIVGGISFAIIFWIGLAFLMMSRRGDSEFAGTPKPPTNESARQRPMRPAALPIRGAVGKPAKVQAEQPLINGVDNGPPQVPTAPLLASESRVEQPRAPIGVALRQPAGPGYVRLSGAGCIELAQTGGLSDLNRPFTAEIWITLDLQRPQNVIMGNYARVTEPPAAKSQTSGWLLYFLNRNPLVNDRYVLMLFCNREQSGGSGSGSSHPQLAGGPHHFCVCRGSEEVHLFVDGKLRGRHFPRTNDAFRCNNENFCLGSPPHAREKTGTWGDVRAFRLSSGTRYEKEFEPPQSFSKDPDTLVLLDFSHGEQDKVFDLSGGEHHGKLVGAEWVPTSPRDLAAPPQVAAPPLIIPAPPANGESAPAADDLATASVGGKYMDLRKIILAPADKLSYGKFKDYGFSALHPSRDTVEAPPSYWVYLAPNWYVWGKTGQSAKTIEENAARSRLAGRLSKFIDLISGDELLLEHALRWYPHGTRPSFGLRIGVGLQVAARPDDALDYIDTVAERIRQSLTQRLESRREREKFGVFDVALEDLNTGNRSELLARARQECYDIAVLIDQTVLSDAKEVAIFHVRIVDPRSERTLWSSAALSSNLVKNSAPGGIDPVGDLVDEFIQRLDSDYTLEPRALTREQAERRKRELSAGPAYSNPLPVVAEIRVYHTKQFLTVDEAAALYEKLLGGGRGQTFAIGNLDERRKVLQEWHVSSGFPTKEGK